MILVAAMSLALSLGQSLPEPVMPDFGMESETFKKLFWKIHWEKFRRAIADNSDINPSTVLEDYCYWAYDVVKYVEIAERNYPSNPNIPSLQRAKKNAQDFIDRNCNNNIRVKYDAAWIVAKAQAVKGQSRDIDLVATGLKEQFPTALPPCKGILTTSGVCSPDYRLLVAAVIVIALFIPGPIDDAATAGLIVRLAAP